MKPRIAILFNGQMRANSLNPEYKSDTLILDSIAKYFINDEFKSKYEYDIFISTDNNIDIKHTNAFFGNNLKNIHIIETDWYLHECRHSIPEYKYYHDKYINIDFKGYNNCVESLYSLYRLYDAYNLMKNYIMDTNTQYNYIIQIRPDLRLMKNFVPLFNILDTTNIQVIAEHAHIIILKYKVREILEIIKYMGTYTESRSTKINIYNYLCRGDPSDGNRDEYIFAPEKQILDHIYAVLSINNYNFYNSFIGITYPSFHVLYRGNGVYGHVYNYHLIDTIPWVPFTDIKPIIQKLNLLDDNIFDINIKTKFIEDISLELYDEKLNYPHLKSLIEHNNIEYICQRLCIHTTNDLYFNNHLYFKDSYTNTERLEGIDIKAQDPRLVVVNDIVYTIFSCTSPYENQSICIGISQFNCWKPTFLRIRGIVPNNIEKNWAPFSKNNKLYFVYTYDPLVILHYDFNDDGYCDIIFHKEEILNSINNNTTMRGSTNLIHYKDEYYIGGCHTQNFINNIMYYLPVIIILDTKSWKLRYVSKPILFEYTGNKFLKINNYLFDSSYIKISNSIKFFFHYPMSLYKRHNDRIILILSLRESYTLKYELNTDNLDLENNILDYPTEYCNNITKDYAMNINNYIINNNPHY
jgi:hypothetical protein